MYLHVTYVHIRLGYSLEFEHLVFIMHCVVQQICLPKHTNAQACYSLCRPYTVYYLFGALA